MFSDYIFTKIGPLRFPKKLKMVEIHFNFFPIDSIKEILPVLEVKDGEKNISWHNLNFNKQIKLNEWNKCELKQFLFLNEMNDNYVLNFYFWNKGKRNFFIDDLSIFYYSLK